MSGASGEIVTTKDVEIEITGGVLLHVGPQNGGCDPRAFKAKGYKLIWVLTPEELKANMPLADEKTLVWQSDDQMRRMLHDEMYLWRGATILPDCERQQKLAGIMADLVNLHEFNEHSNVELSKNDLPTRNAFRNFQWYENGVSLSRVRDKGKGQPAVLIAAGPSLNEQWPYLRKLRETRKDIPFIICGRSYRKAMTEGVWPEFVIEVEQYDWDADLFMFALPPPEHSILAFPVTAAPRLAKVWPGMKLCLLNHNIAKIMGLEVGKESVDGGNSVLHYAVTLANVLGSSPLYLAGVDFGYPKGKAEDTHADGTFHPWPYDVLRTEHTHQEGLEAEANDGGKVMTSLPYQNFGTYLSVQIERAKAVQPDLKVYSFSKKGLKIAGVEYTAIEEMVK